MNPAAPARSFGARDLCARGNASGKIWFTTETSLRSFTAIPTRNQPVDHALSRKNFFAKLAGLIAAVGLAPQALVKRATAAPGRAAAKNPPFQIRPEPRAIARDDVSR